MSKKTQISKAEARDDASKSAVNPLHLDDTTTDDKGSTAHKNSIDLIFMDIQMPRMSGHEAARQIRNIETPDHHIPIIALTAHGLADERDKLIASGINDYVGKPISQPQLLQVLQKWLGRTDSVPPLTTIHSDNLYSADLHADLQSGVNQNALTSYADVTTPTYPLVKDNDDNRIANASAVAKVKSPAKITRPLSLKKIRDDYLRDSQPREEYRRETPRETQPRYEKPRYEKPHYENLHYQGQGQVPLAYPPYQMSEHAKYEQAVNTAHGQNNTDMGANTLDTSEILNWQDALTRSANKPDLAAKLIIMMLDTINDEKQALMQAWESRNRSALAQIAHRILGGSRYTGVPQLRQASQDLEDKCLLNIQHTTPAQFAMLEPYYEALFTALNNLQTLDLSAYPQLNYHRLSENDMTWKMI